jgi:hypothetical protein
MLREQNLDMIKMQEEKTNAWKEKWAYHDPPAFKARPLPESNRPGLYDEILRQKELAIEQARNRVITRPDGRAEYLARYFKQYEDKAAEKRAAAEAESLRKMREEFRFKPKVSKRPDNFDWETYFKNKQHEFRSQLDYRKQEYRNKIEETAPQAFKLHESRPRKRGVKRTFLDGEGGKIGRSASAPPGRRRINWRKEPKIMPAMTQKFCQLVEANKQKRFLKYNEGVKSKLIEEEKARRRGEFAKRVIYSPAIVAELQREHEMRLKMEQDRRYLMRHNDDEFDDMMDGIRSRVNGRPLLVEQAPYFDMATNTEEMEQPIGSNPETDIIEIEEVQREQLAVSS